MRLSVFLALFVTLVVAVLHPSTAGWFSPAFWGSWLRLGNAMQTIQQYYVDGDNAGYEAQAERALAKMLADLDDYSSYLPEAYFEEFHENTQQQYVGIGIQIQRLRQRVTVVEVFDNSPAAASGLLAGDQIVGVDGTDMTESSLTEMVEKLRGEEGTTVNVTIYRPRGDTHLTRQIERQLVHFPRVRDLQVRDEIAYLRLTQFGAQTSEEFMAALAQLESQGARALIVDLRDNPGGLLSAAVEVADAFLPAGQPVVITRGRTGERINRTEHPPAIDWPVVILQNRDSASASEIVAGALQDYHRAIIVGEVSTGKGSVQTIFSFGNDTGMRLTTAKYYLPSDRTIQDTGVQPDITVELTEAERAVTWAHQGHQDLSDEAFEAQFGLPRPVDRQRNVAETILAGLLALENAAP